MDPRLYPSWQNSLNQPIKEANPDSSNTTVESIKNTTFSNEGTHAPFSQPTAPQNSLPAATEHSSAEPTVAQPLHTAASIPSNGPAPIFTPPKAFATTAVTPAAVRRSSKGLAGKWIALLLILSIVISACVGAGAMLVANQLLGTSGSGQSVAYVSANRTGTVTSPSAGELTVAQIAELAADSVVEIRTESVVTGSWLRQAVQEGAGSGVIITTDGTIITNNHVIEDASKITVTLHNGSSYNATLVATDAQTDIALLKIDGTDLQPAVLGTSRSLQVGETAVAIGNPLGELGGTVTTGIISALDRDITLDGKQMRLLQTNAAINPGNSGGGLFNGSGELIGLVVAKSSGTGVEGLGFAIPIDLVRSVVKELSENGYVKGRIDLGMEFVDIDSTETAMQYRVSRLGLYVKSVTGTVASKAGFRPGDCIAKVGETTVSTSAELTSALSDAKVGDTVTFTVIRSGVQGQLQMTLEEATGSTSSKNGILG